MSELLRYDEVSSEHKEKKGSWKEQARHEIQKAHEYFWATRRKWTEGMTPEQTDEFNEWSKWLDDIESEAKAIEDRLKGIDKKDDNEARATIQEFNDTIDISETKQIDWSRFAWLSSHENTREIQEITYEIFWINSETYKNPRTLQLVKGIIDSIFISNAEFIEQIIETKWQILVDIIEYVFTIEWLENIAISLWESFADLVSWDRYKTWQTIWDLWLISSWVTIAWFWLKRIKKWFMKEGEKIAESMWKKIELRIGKDWLYSINDTIHIVNERLWWYKELADILEKFLKDTEHPMDINKLLRNPDTSWFVLDRLWKIAETWPMDQKTFESIVKDISSIDHPIFRSNDLEFSYTDWIKRSELYSDRLLSNNSKLFSLAENPTLKQIDQLDIYQKRLAWVIEPKLKIILGDIVDRLDQEWFKPQMSVRTKSADDIAEKISRMIKGNKERLPRPDYNLSEMPDAVWWRITVENIDDLTSVIESIENIFWHDWILEKDSFYSNPKKVDRAFRLVTYTVLVDWVPCEIQINTINASLVWDLDHNVVYKWHITESTDLQKEYVKWLARRWNAIDLQKLRK